MQLVNDIVKDFPLLGSIPSGVLIEIFSDVEYKPDFSNILKKKSISALIVNGDSIIYACIFDEDIFLIEPIMKRNSIRNGNIISLLVVG